MEIEWLDVTDEQRIQARGIVELVEQVTATMPPVHTVAPAVTRRQRAEGTSVLPAPAKLDHAIDRTLPGPAGEVAIRMIVPDEVRGVYLHIHGGGWTLGAADQQDALLDFLATQLDVAVVSLEYRLAPEHPYPAGPDDCEAVAVWLVENAQNEFGSERLLIGGESAGAHLSAVTLLRMRDRHQAASRFVAANLVFGLYDFGLTPSVRRWGDRNLVLSTPIIQWFADNFLGALSPDERQRPDVSPLHADLAALPPAFFTVGELDPLLDDSLFMASRSARGRQRRTGRDLPGVDPRVHRLPPRHRDALARPAGRLPRAPPRARPGLTRRHKGALAAHVARPGRDRRRASSRRRLRREGHDEEMDTCLCSGGGRFDRRGCRGWRKRTGASGVCGFHLQWGRSYTPRPVSTTGGRHSVCWCAPAPSGSPSSPRPRSWFRCLAHRASLVRQDLLSALIDAKTWARRCANPGISFVLI